MSFVSDIFGGLNDDEFNFSSALLGGPGVVTDLSGSTGLRSGIKDVFLGKKGSPSRLIESTPEEFIGLREPIAQTLEQLITTGGPQFQGDFTAGLSPNEQSLLQQITQLGGETALGTQSEDFLSQVLSGQFLTPDSNPFLSDLISSLQRRETENFERFTLPRLRTGFTAAGQSIAPQGSSPFDQSVALSTSDLLNRLSDISSGIGFQGFQAERGFQQEAVGQAQQLTTANLNNAIEALRAEALPRLIEQFGLDQGLAEFRRRVDVILQSLGIGGALAQPTTDVLPGAAGTTGQGGNIIGGLLGAAGGLLSSRMFKTSKRKVGPVLEKLDELPVERWEYKRREYGPPGEHIGPYAEDFRDAFGVGDGRTINVVDAMGVALAAIKELKARVEELENG